MIHRALYGSYERFFMVLTEHYNGKFPTWLAPEQVRILPISDDNIPYAEEIKRELGDYRVTIEERSWTVKRKIRQGHEDRVPYMLILGDDEEESATVSVRDRKEREKNDVSIEAFRDHLADEVGEQRTEPDFLD
jgi:threonyl-tRNA synthetase